MSHKHRTRPGDDRQKLEVKHPPARESPDFWLRQKLGGKEDLRVVPRWGGAHLWGCQDESGMRVARS